MNFVKQKRAIVGLEAAIILIAFVIIAAVFSFMVINQGLFATNQGKSVIQEGLTQASTPLSEDGTIFVKTNDAGTNVTGFVIPLKSFGVDYVSLDVNATVITLEIGGSAWPNVYAGVNTTATSTTSATLDDLLTGTAQGTAVLYIQGGTGGQVLDSSSKGYLVFSLSPDNAALARAQVNVEIRLEATAPLSVQFTVPESMPADSWVNV